LLESLSKTELEALTCDLQVLSYEIYKWLSFSTQCWKCCKKNNDYDWILLLILTH
jgi:hypothetical protein